MARHGRGLDAHEKTLRRQGWALIWREMRPQRAYLVYGVLAALVWTLAKLSVPLIVAAAIDQGIEPGDGGQIVKYTVLVLIVGVVQGLGMGARRYTAFRMSYRLETDLRDRLFAHLQLLHFSFHDQAQTGQLMSRANTDLLTINQMVTLGPITLSSVFILVGVVTIMAFSNIVLALLALGALPLLTVFATRFQRSAGPVGFDQQRKIGDLSGVVEETVSGIRVVKGFGAEQVQLDRLEAEADGVYTEAMRFARLRAGFLPLLDFIPALSLAAILFYGGHQVLDGNLAIGDLVAFNLYVVMLIVPLRLAGQLVAQTIRASASAGRVHEILATAPEVVDALDAQDLAEGDGELRFEHVRFGYGPTTPVVLDDFDLVLRPGEAVALVGSTASGKSTVARLIPRFYDVDAGSILFDGVDVRALKVQALRQAVGIVFEDTFLFSDSVRSNIAFAHPEASMDQVIEAAELAGASDFIDRLPDGYETVIGEHGFSLSGGQRQRLAIARAVLADPRVLILDDATSSVDPTKEHEIRSALHKVMEGRTTLIIAHRPATVALADRVVFLDHGRVVDSGTHEELLARSAEYRTVLAHADGDEGDGEIDLDDAAVSGDPQWG